MSLEQKFKNACERVRSFTKRPPDADMLEIYCLYKQSTVGNINTTKPETEDGKLKWDAWNRKKGMSQTAAKEAYVAKIDQLALKFA